jgi:hypothetical protein
MSKLESTFKTYSQTADEIERIALQDYTASLCLIDLDLHQDRENWKVDNDQVTQRMTSYFQSSQYKNAFARLMGYSYYVKRPSTVSWISRRIVISRTAANAFVKDCLAENWIMPVQITDKTKGYWATDVLLKGLEEHAVYTASKVESIGVNKKAAKLKKATKCKVSLRSNRYQNVAD